MVGAMPGPRADDIVACRQLAGSLAADPKVAECLLRVLIGSATDWNEHEDQTA
jgi:hypothetical protein